jgi:hypothetical protein
MEGGETMKQPISLLGEKAFDAALGFAKVLCKLGYGTLIIPNRNGRFLIFYLPKERSFENGRSQTSLEDRGQNETAR